MQMRHVAVFLGAALAACSGRLAKLVASGDSHELRTHSAELGASSPRHAKLLILAFDGVDRALLYSMLRDGELPALSRLLGGQQGSTFPHAHFDDTFLATLPSSTMAAWVTALTGVTPAQHGVTGNEFFIREERRFAAPAPTSFSSHDPVLATYTDEYLNKLDLAPTVYERMRREDPTVLVWVAMQQLYAGADRFLLTKPTVVVEAFEAFVEETVTKLVTQKEARVAYERLDKDTIDVVLSHLDDGAVPDVLTIYLSGTDLYAHVASEGPEVSRRAYLREVVDPQMERLGDKLRARNALDDRFVVVTSDHGHTEVVHDDMHALGTGSHSPATLLTKAGYRVRPFKLEVSPEDDFQAVLAYQGALAYVYVADRSTCAQPKHACNWALPPRYDADVLPLADAFYENDRSGAIVPAMKGTLDMVLTRRPRPYAETDNPFEVYVGHGRTVPVEAYLAEHPHPTYVDLGSRLRALGVGPHGERAGDVLLIAHNGDRATPAERYYFAEPYHSWHGSPSRKDSEIPLIVAHRLGSSRDIGVFVRGALGDEPHQEKLTDLLLGLRRLAPLH